MAKTKQARFEAVGPGLPGESPDRRSKKRIRTVSLVHIDLPAHDR